jgi:nucleoside-diphosphate-sugar epimerase
VVHQLTDLAGAVAGQPVEEATLRGNARIRTEGTENLVAAALAAGARRVVAQSIAWLYAPGPEPHDERDPLLPLGPTASISLAAVHALERQVLDDPRFDGVVLRYGRLYGDGTWTPLPPEPPTVSVAGAAEAAALAVARGAPGVYNIVDDGGPVANARARHELGWRPG